MFSRNPASTGRAAQRLRTRTALLEAAARLVQRGESPRLAAVAAEARISRATVYRYFPNEQALLLEAPLALHFLSAREVLAGHADAPALARVLAVHRYVYDHAVANEAQFRLMLAAIHEQAARDAPKEALRTGRRQEMFREALAPARASLGKKELRLLVNALSLMTGIDALVVYRDVCGLTAAEGRAAAEWAIRRLVGASLGES